MDKFLQNKPDADKPDKDIPALKWLRRLHRIFLSLVLLSVLFFGLSVLGLLYLRSQPLPEADIRLTTKIVDTHGLVIDTLYYGQNRVYVPLDKISDNLVKATLAIEDHRFYDHYGFDWKGIGRAIIVDIQNMSKTQGASTITQQLARNLYLTMDQTWTRKIKEAIYTLQLEMQYPKQEILAKYLNQIYYGHSAYGVQAAARTYFGKNADQLSLAESAILAGVPKGPTYYSPYNNFANAKRRQQDILNAMVRYGYITKAEADKAYKEKIELKPLSSSPSKAPYFRDYVKQLAVQKYGIDEEQLFQGGLTIYTTLDLQLQQKAEHIVDKNLPTNGKLQAALVAVDPNTGYIRAMVGGRDYKKNQYNRALAKRQPGSSFKPVLYLAALENGYTALNSFRSQPTIFTYDGNKTYSPSNYGDHYAYKDILLREAIARSDNIFAVNTIMNIGAGKVVDMAHKLGITSPMKAVPSLALGTFPVSPLEMASAFSVLANEGSRIKPTAIVKIEDNKGNTIVEEKPKLTPVVNPASTYVLTDLMKSVFEDPTGTAHRVQSLLKRPVAGKTGTTNTDAWLTGYNPDLVASVWVGYDQNRELGTMEARIAAPIWAEFMEEANQYLPAKPFPIPKGITLAYIDPTNGKLANGYCPGTRLEAFVTGTEPTETCTVHHAPDKIAAPQQQEPSDNGGWLDKFKNWWND